MPTCPKCNIKYEEGKRFCKNCGGALEERVIEEKREIPISAPSYTPPPAPPIKEKRFPVIPVVIGASVGFLILVGIILAIAIPNFLGVKDKARITSAQQSLSSLRKAEEMHYADYDYYTNDIDALKRYTNVDVLLTSFEPYSFKLSASINSYRMEAIAKDRNKTKLIAIPEGVFTEDEAKKELAKIEVQKVKEEVERIKQELKSKKVLKRQGNGPDVICKRAPKNVIIDGELTEWANYSMIILDSRENVVFKPQNWKGKDDVSGKFIVAYDDKNLYIVACVIDDILRQSFKGEKMINGDHIEIFFDIDLEDDFYDDKMSDDDIQIGISPGKFIIGSRRRPETDEYYPFWKLEEPSVYVYHPKLGKNLSLIEVASSCVYDDPFETEVETFWRGDRGSSNMIYAYLIEAKIPFTFLGEDFKPSKNTIIGIQLNISDSDQKDKQGCYLSSSPRYKYFNPTTFNNLIFQ